jgi:hypothetical protein
MEVDHLFICVSPDAREAETLKAFGLTEGPANRHAGQGTANRRFFFRNAYIELLYLRDPAEAGSDLTMPTKLYDRLTINDEGVSPFGMGFRPAENTDKRAPFPSWRYKPIYLPEDLGIDIGDSPVSEPMWFFVSFGSRPDSLTLEMRPALAHPIGFREITSLRIVIPTSEQFSAPAMMADRVEGVEIVRGDAHLLQIGFDGEPEGRRHDFRPILPLVCRW